MSPRLFLLRVVEPGLYLLPAYMTSDAARIQLMAMAGVESNWSARAQTVASGPPPALGFWQFEAVAVEAVLKQTAALAQSVLATCDIPVSDAHAAIQYNDQAACAFARLLLWFDPAPLPPVGDCGGSFSYYQKVWKPGRPDQARWTAAYQIAVSTVAAEK